MKDNIIIVDASHLMHRLYHTNSHDLQRAVNLYLFRIKNFIYFHKPTEVHICFDEGGSDYRRELYPTYKNNRPPLPDDMRKLKNMLIKTSLSITSNVYMKRGIEADDIIASITEFYRFTHSVLILTCDKDIHQLLAGNVKIIHPFKLIETTMNNLKHQTGIDPEHVVDYLSLVGDNADCIKGIDGIGKATAIRLLGQYDSIADMLVMEESNELVIEKIKAHKDQLLLNIKLVRLLRNLPFQDYLIQNI